MPKLTPARLAGLYGMRRFTARELHERADQYESRISDPHNTDDPRWLRRWADRVRKLALQKEAAEEHKQAQRK